MPKLNVAQPLVPVKFRHPHAAYNPGEVAGFDKDFAARLVKAEIAVPYKERSIKFLKEHAIGPATYEVGEVATIDAELVDELFERKIAEPHATKPATADVKK